MLIILFIKSIEIHQIPKTIPARHPLNSSQYSPRYPLISSNSPISQSFPNNPWKFPVNPIQFLNQHPKIAEVTMPPPPQPTPVKPKAAAPTEKKVVKEDPLKARRGGWWLIFLLGYTWDTPPSYYSSWYIWVNYNDLTATSLEIMVSKGNHPQMALIQVSELL